MEENYLSHYGVKGMKWGIRRTEAQLARARGGSRFPLFGKKKKSAKPSAKKASSSDSKPKKDSIKDLSDDELRKRISRLEMEKKYKDLSSSSEQAKSNKGRAFVSRVLEKAGEDIAVQIAREGMARAVNKIFKEEIVFANNKKK